MWRDWSRPFGVVHLWTALPVTVCCCSGGDRMEDRRRGCRHEERRKVGHWSGSIDRGFARAVVVWGSVWLWASPARPLAVPSAAASTVVLTGPACASQPAAPGRCTCARTAGTAHMKARSWSTASGHSGRCSTRVRCGRPGVPVRVHRQLLAAAAHRPPPGPTCSRHRGSHTWCRLAEPRRT